MNRQPNRRQPSVEDRERVLIEQRGHCLYCHEPLDGYVFRKGKVTWLEVQWDHFIPHSYSGANPYDNWVAACQVCNGIKSDLIFKSVTDAQEYIQQRRKQLGYTTERPAGVWPTEWEEDDDRPWIVGNDELPDENPVRMVNVIRYPEPATAPRVKPKPVFRPVRHPAPRPRKPDEAHPKTASGSAYRLPPDGVRCSNINKAGKRCKKRIKADGLCDYHLEVRGLA